MYKYELLGTDIYEIVKNAEILLRNYNEYNKMTMDINPYGYGHASKRIVEAIIHHYYKRNIRTDAF